MNQQDSLAIEQRIRIIKDNICESALKVNRNIDEIKIMAVTKTVCPQYVNLALSHGINLIGENKVQEYLQKIDTYNIKKNNVHFIGHLQTNKVKYIINKVGMIESVSSLKLAYEIDKKASEIDTIMDVLLQVNIGEESSKHGFFNGEVKDAINQISHLKNVKIKGIMCIPPKENSEYFLDKMSSLFFSLKHDNIENTDIKYLSMGMSGDYKNAILHNSNIIRLGSAIFGERNNGG